MLDRFRPSRTLRSSHLRASLFLSAVLASSFALSSCDSGSTTPDVDFVEFDATVQSFLDAHSLSGATVVVVHRDHGVLHQRAFGSFDVNRISLLASASKVLSAGILVRLADQGLIDLDAPISSYLGAEYGLYKTDITVAQLLSNSAGMVGLVDDALYGPYVCQYLPLGFLVDCAAGIYTADDAADRVPPDTKFRYGGGQWQLAGGIAEAVTGKSWHELVDETYVRPCGLETLGYTNQYAQAFMNTGGVSGALGYPSFFTGDLGQLMPTDNPNVEGGAYTNVRDYAKILLMHLRGGRCGDRRVLSEAGVARMQADRIGEVYGGSTSLDPTLPGYGLGWWVSREQPGFVADPGAYGATPWIDNERGYAAMIILEADSTLGAQLRMAAKPVLEAAIDAAGL